MATYDVGDRARLYLSLTDINGAPTNGTVVLTVTGPTGTTSTPTVVNDSTGQYHADLDITTAGRWSYVWTSTGAVIASEPGVLEVAATSPTALVSLDDAKAHLNITTTDSDDELRMFIDAATDYIESKVGPVVRRTVTDVVIPYDGVLSLKPPVISLTSVTSAYGYTATYDTANMYADPVTGVVQYGAYSATFAYPVTVTYVAGRVNVPALIRQAALDYIQWMWTSQRGATALTISGDYETVAPATVPYKITQALEPYMNSSSGVA